MLFPGAEDTEVIGRLAVHHDFLDLISQDHPGNALKGVLENPVPVLYRREMMMKGIVSRTSHVVPPMSSACRVQENLFASFVLPVPIIKAAKIAPTEASRSSRAEPALKLLVISGIFFKESSQLPVSTSESFEQIVKISRKKRTGASNSIAYKLTYPPADVKIVLKPASIL
jgi:hypothetical protein